MVLATAAPASSFEPRPAILAVHGFISDFDSRLRLRLLSPTSTFVSILRCPLRCTKLTPFPLTFTPRLHLSTLTSYPGSDFVSRFRLHITTLVSLFSVPFRVALSTIRSPSPRWSTRTSNCNPQSPSLQLLLLVFVHGTSALQAQHRFRYCWMVVALAVVSMKVL